MTSLAGVENVGLKLAGDLSLDLESWQRYQLSPAVSSSDSPLPGPGSPPLLCSVPVWPRPLHPWAAPVTSE